MTIAKALLQQFGVRPHFVHNSFGHNLMFTITLENMKLYYQLLCQKFQFWWKKTSHMNKDPKNSIEHRNKCHKMKDSDFRRS